MWRWIIEKARESQKNLYFCFIECAKAFDCVDHNKLWEIPKEMEILDHLTCLLRNRMQVKKHQLELDLEQQAGSKLGKEYIKAVFCHCLFNFYEEYIIRNAGLDEAKAGIKIAGRNISNMQMTPPLWQKAKN